ncbi:MAG: serine/threonine protein kinase [Silicimonas sp.]|nr:serine/threonine protein kinase [Silicimonas sp.]
MTDKKTAHMADLAEQALPIGTVLSDDQFTITDHLGAGGFGITYKAKDNVLGRTVVIKECFPEDFCVRENHEVFARSKTYAKPIRSIIKMFMREAQSLAKLRHPNIVSVHRIFEENGTAYMVLDLIEGKDLFDIIEGKKIRLSPARVKDILFQLLDAIDKVHAMGLLHRDISPDNILIERTGTPVLIDFGAARADATRHTRAISSFLVVKDGYSPQEFYVAGSEQGPSSDLYALAASFYHVLSGSAPPNSQTRLLEIAGGRTDPCVPLVGRIPGYDDAFLEAIDRAMTIHPADRLQSAAKWRRLIEESVSASEGPKSEVILKPSSQGIPLDLELSLTKLVEETNDEVRKTSEIILPEEPKAEPPKPEAKPAWVEEFNAESLSRPHRSKRSSRQAYLSKPAPTSGEDEGWVDTRRAYINSHPTHTGTNWIDRALEKQGRIRSERELALEALEKEATGRAGPVPSQQGRHAEVEIPRGVAAAPAVAARGPLRTIGILICLALSVSCLFFLPAP